MQTTTPTVVKGAEPSKTQELMDALFKKDHAPKSEVIRGMIQSASIAGDLTTFTDERGGVLHAVFASERAEFLSPLFFACDTELPKVLELKDARGKTAVDLAIEKSEWGMLRALVRSSPEPLHRGLPLTLLSPDYPQKLMLQILRGCENSAVESRGKPFDRNLWDLLETLVRKIPEKSAETAALYGRVLHLLFDQLPRVDVVPAHMPEDVAVEVKARIGQRCLELLDYFIAAGADLNAANNGGTTLLERALRACPPNLRGTASVADLLLYKMLESLTPEDVTRGSEKYSQLLDRLILAYDPVAEDLIAKGATPSSGLLLRLARQKPDEAKPRFLEIVMLSGVPDVAEVRAALRVLVAAKDWSAVQSVVNCLPDDDAKNAQLLGEFVTELVTVPFTGYSSTVDSARVTALGLMLKKGADVQGISFFKGLTLTMTDRAAKQMPEVFPSIEVNWQTVNNLGLGIERVAMTEAEHQSLIDRMSKAASAEFARACHNDGTTVFHRAFYEHPMQPSKPHYDAGILFDDIEGTVVMAEKFQDEINHYLRIDDTSEDGPKVTIDTAQLFNVPSARGASNLLLHHICRNYSPSTNETETLALTKYVLELGADPRAVNADGQTALEEALWVGPSSTWPVRWRMAQVILENTPENMRDLNLYNRLLKQVIAQYDATSGTEKKDFGEVIVLLQEKGAQLESTDPDFARLRELNAHIGRNLSANFSTALSYDPTVTSPYEMVLAAEALFKDSAFFQGVCAIFDKNMFGIKYADKIAEDAEKLREAVAGNHGSSAATPEVEEYLLTSATAFIAKLHLGLTAQSGKSPERLDVIIFNTLVARGELRKQTDADVSFTMRECIESIAQSAYGVFKKTHDENKALDKFIVGLSEELADARATQAASGGGAGSGMFASSARKDQSSVQQAKCSWLAQRLSDVTAMRDWQQKQSEPHIALGRD